VRFAAVGLEAVRVGALRAWLLLGGVALPGAVFDAAGLAGVPVRAVVVCRPLPGADAVRDLL
jgi:hypothetical protein